ncbi:MAG TPA: hypothetical protein ENJ53_09485 [Phaeodactylibacter sp.]|nr:hypothetical protein [Phaeodactylibacter sp.]
MAVFTLPPDLIIFYKKHIEFLTDHAVDPDKRRYASKHEAIRHYIDLDVWGKYPFDDFPKTHFQAIMKYTDFFWVNEKHDTIQLMGNELRIMEDDFYIKFKTQKKQEVVISKKDYQKFIYNNVLALYYEDEWLINCDSFQHYFGEIFQLNNCQQVIGKDRFSEFGILPFNLMRVQKKLTNAFRNKNVPAILRQSAELGHYIGDAHVPLHTTENYNGQMTNQNGIHAFWESRIPELFANEEYDFFVGKAKYIENKQDYFWKIVLESHQLVDSVLSIEAALVKAFPQDKQFCFDERNGITTRLQCRAFAKAYSDRMQGMVEQRMTQSIQAVGCMWYTAWVDAGQPDLSIFSKKELTDAERKELEELENAYRKGEIKGRAHSN